MDRYSLSVALGILVQKPLNQANDAALVSAAIEFWYAELDLEIEMSCFLEQAWNENELRRAGYLIERLTRFPCLSDERAEIALAGLPCWFAHLRQENNKIEASSRRIDALAISWGVSEGLGLKAQVLLPYQTRHVLISPPT
jgi:hypothetical protein